MFRTTEVNSFLEQCDGIVNAAINGNIRDHSYQKRFEAAKKEILADRKADETKNFEYLQALHTISLDLLTQLKLQIDVNVFENSYKSALASIKTELRPDLTPGERTTQNTNYRTYLEERARRGEIGLCDPKGDFPTTLQENKPTMTLPCGVKVAVGSSSIHIVGFDNLSKAQKKQALHEMVQVAAHKWPNKTFKMTGFPEFQHGNGSSNIHPFQRQWARRLYMEVAAKNCKLDDADRERALKTLSSKQRLRIDDRIDKMREKHLKEEELPQKFKSAEKNLSNKTAARPLDDTSSSTPPSATFRPRGT